MTPLTRRGLVHRVGRAGGVAAAYRIMAAMGLLPIPASYAGPPALAPGNGQKIVILGAGIAGMVAAYELGRAGYACTVLEARARPGGRNWSLRAGDKIEEIDSTQTVNWDTAAHLYVNPGPARLPQHHQGILSYCRMLGVDLEVMSNDNRAALLHDDHAFGGKPQRARQVINDTRGYIAEMAAKAIDKAALDAPVTDEDRTRLRGMLRSFGALDRDLAYRGSARAGFDEAPGAGTQSGRITTPLDLRRLLQADFWQYKTQFAESWDQAPTMMQPVGGMGRIGQAFGRKLGDVITYEAIVTALRRTGAGARVEWKHARTGAVQALDVDHVLCTIPLPVLKDIPNDFSPAVRSAIAAVDYVPACKVAYQAEHRFWETRDNIYGGISWTTRDSTQIWYPSAGLHQQKGILVGAYIWSDKIGQAYASRTPAERAAATRADVEVLHPGAELGASISVAWPKIPFNRAAWAEWSQAARREHYPVLLAGDGPFRFAGEHMSYITGWQEGAVLSAHYAIAEFART